MMNAPSTAKPSGKNGQTSNSTPLAPGTLYRSSNLPRTTPASEPPKYCAPSNNPAAVAAAFRPPKSIEAAPPTSECALWMKKEIATNTIAAPQAW